MEVALYPRVSGHEQEGNYSIPEQIERMQKYCDARDWMVYKIYTDSGYTGSNLNRPGLQQMIKDAENHKFDMVLVYKLDRLSRSQKDVLYLVEDVFDKHGVFFTSMTENFDTSTPFGKAILGILAVFAQLEREQIKERTMMGKQARAEEGKWHGSKWIPIGYDYTNGELKPNDYEVMQIREMAGLFIKRTPVRTIATMMNEKGYRHKHGQWDAKTVKRVLTNPVNIGMLKHKDKYYKGQHKAILDQKTFDKIIEINNERKEEYGTAYKAHKSLLGGFLYCKHCGGRYARQSNGKQRRMYYACYSRSKKVPKMVKDPNCKNKYHHAPDLDELVLSEIKKLAIDPTYIQEIKDNKPVSDFSEKIKAITSEIAKIDSQVSKMMDLYALGTIDIDVISSRVTELNKTKDSLTRELEELEAPADNEVITDTQIKDLATLLTDELDLNDKRRVIQSLIYYIEIDNDDVIIHWKF